MAMTKSRIAKNLRRIQERVVEACAKARREPAEVSIVAVTKTADLETVKTMIDLGLRDLGESRAQQLIRRAEEVHGWLTRRRGEAIGDVRWHMIGHVQRNKVRQVLPAATVIHSVDSLRLAEEINARAEGGGRTVDMLLQVNCSQESQKFGCAVGAAPHLAELICTLRHVRLIGLMTMAELTDDAEKARPAFALLREMFEEMRHQGVGGDDFRHLSMGMSQDYAVAVEEGATILRIGSALLQ